MADGFLGRWSRRKQEVREGKPVEDPPPTALTSTASAPQPLPGALPTPTATPVAEASEAPRATAEAPPPPPTLADAQDLTSASDFKAFVARDVPPEVRNLAMKKLFADPHFNVMDGLDIYVGDYTQPDPLPEGMLRKLASAHAMGFFDKDQTAETSSVAPTQPAYGAGAPIAPEDTRPREGAEAQGSQGMAQSGVCNAIPSAPSSEREVATPADEASVATAASHTDNDHDAHLRLQPDDAPQRQGAGRGTA